MVTHHQPPSHLLPFFTSYTIAQQTMCRLRQVRNIYLQCGHGVTEPDVMVQCENSKCRFSPFHPSSCKQPRCRQTCIQYHSFPEQYSPQLNRLCPMCQNMLASRGRR